MELLLNLVWALISCGAALAWIVWRRTSNSKLVPALGRGLLVVGCIIVLLFPVISITDDLAQAAALAEGNKLQDVLKAPELRHLAVLLPFATLIQPTSLASRNTFWRDDHDTTTSLQILSWSPSIEKRPPPRIL